jgi:predicted  nucleic acid-binding Zn-ribbon protein
MGRTLEALLKLQSIELQVREVRNRLKMQSAAVDAQQARVEQLQGEYQKLHDESVARQQRAADVELELKSREERVVKLRAALNTAKTNKEYAALLTQLNTIKADNSKLEDEALNMMQEVDQARQQAAEVKQQIEDARDQLEQVNRSSSEEIATLEGMLAKLELSRADAAGAVPSDARAVFERIAATRGGEAMANIQIEGKKPPYDYICGGCFMSIAAENANALRTRDELRFCDNCGRILYLAEQTTPQEA